MIKEDCGDLKISLTVSGKHESTSAPWWIIIDPAQNLRTGTEACYRIASMITGPFFSRKEAQEWLDKTRYNFGPNAVVYCHSGHQSKQYEKAYYDAREGKQQPAPIPALPQDVRDALVKARDLYLQDIKDCGPCDHSVNICVCGLIHEAEQIDKLLARHK